MRSNWVVQLFVTFSVSLMEPFPLMKTRQPLDASTRLRELPLGPRMRPTKLNWRTVKTQQIRNFYCAEGLNKLQKAYIRVSINWNLHAHNLLDDIWARTWRCSLPIHTCSRRRKAYPLLYIKSKLLFLIRHNRIHLFMLITNLKRKCW